MKNIKILTLLLCLSSLSSCSTLAFAPMLGAETVKSTFPEKLSEEATKEQQEEVKTQVMKLLEEEYKQPFKLESFDYKYETHASSHSLPATYSKYGIYSFKVKAVDNPIIEMNFSVDDNKDSIKPLIESFKKTQLKERYCRGFAAYYLNVMNNREKIIQPSTKETEKYCDNKGQTWYKEYKDYYLKHKDEYK